MDVNKGTSAKLAYHSNLRSPIRPSVSSLGKRDPLVGQAIANVAPDWQDYDPVLTRLRTDAIYSEIRRLDLENLLVAKQRNRRKTKVLEKTGKVTKGEEIETVLSILVC